MVNAILGYICEGEYNCVRHSPAPTQGELNDGYVTAVYADDEQANGYHCQACYEAANPKPAPQPRDGGYAEEDPGDGQPDRLYGN